MRSWIEATNFVRVVFGEPHFAMMINHDIPGESIERRDFPFVEGVVGRVVHFKGIAHGRGKPESAILIKSQEQGLGIARGKLQYLRPTR